MVWRETGGTALRIYTTTIPTTTRLYTLMHDRQYREAIAWQNTGYNQPPHPSFFLGDGMSPAPVPNIVTSLSVLLGPPAPQLTAISTDSGTSTSDFRTNDTTLVLSGTAQSGATVNVTRLGVGLIGTALADGSGAWSLDYTGTTLPAGEVSFALSATDAANNTGASSAPYVVTIDTAAPAAPAIATISLEAGSLVFAGTAEPGSRVEVLRTGDGSMGVAVADVTGLWTVIYAGPALPQGAHAFTAQATDIAGNTGAPSASFAINTTIGTPVITGIVTDSGISASDGVTNDNRLVLNGTADAGATVQVSILGLGPIGSTTADAGGAWSFDYTGTVLASGARAFAAVATSAAGSSPSSPAFLVTIDTTAPAIVSINRLNPSAATTSAANLTFRVTFSESVAGLDVADFTLVATGTLSGSIASIVPGTAGVFDVAVGPVSGEGTLRLDLNAAGTGITDTAGNALPGGFTAGQVYTRSLTGNGTWTRGATDGLWSANANWQEGIVGSGAGTTVDFSTLELVEDNTVHLDSPRTVGNLVFGDTDITTAAGWTIDSNGDAANVLTLGVVSGTPTVTVNPLGVGATATLATSVAGTQGLTKLGTGMLILSQPSPLTGVLTLSGGEVRLNPGSSLSNGNNAVNLGTNTVLRVSGGSFTTGGLVTAVTASAIVDGGTATMANFRTNSDFGGTLRINGGTLTVGDVNIRRNAGTSPDFNSGFIVAGGTATTTTIGLGTNNSYGSMSVQGGAVTATGTITIGNQATGGRGGALRVLSGALTSTDTVNGIVLGRTNGTNANNVATATFTGGVSTVERITLGYDTTVNAGSATVTVNGGTLYLGSGGIVKKATSGQVSALNFSSGVVGAKASWATDQPVNLPSPGTVAIKAADASDLSFDITLTGVLSGAGGFSKTGGGVLTLSNTSTFAGASSVVAGTLRVDGTLAAAAGGVAVNGGTLTGSGTVARAVTLNAGGRITPGAAVFTLGSLTANGGSLDFDLASGRVLAITGALSRGAAGPTSVVAAASVAPVSGETITLATFSSTDLTLADLTLAPTSGYLGVLQLEATALKFHVTGVGPTAEYTHWAFLEGLPPGLDGPDANPSGDGVANLLKFVLALDPNATTPQGIAPTTVQEGDATYPAIVYIRRKALGGVTVSVLVAPDLEFASDLGAVEVSASDNGDGTELVTVRSAVSTAQQPQQFFRLAATLPAF